MCSICGENPSLKKKERKGKISDSQKDNKYNNVSFEQRRTNFSLDFSRTLYIIQKIQN